MSAKGGSLTFLPLTLSTKKSQKTRVLGHIVNYSSLYCELHRGKHFVNIVPFHREKKMPHTTIFMFCPRFCKGTGAIRHVSQDFDDIPLHFQQQQKVLSSALIPLLIVFGLYSQLCNFEHMLMFTSQAQELWKLWKELEFIACNVLTVVGPEWNWPNNVSLCQESYNWVT